MTEQWAKWEQQVINGVFPLHRCVSFSDHSAVFLTEHKGHDLPNALLKLVPAIPTLKETQLAHWTAAATLAHPHLVPLLEVGHCQLGGLQFLFVVMEYAQETLANVLTQRAIAPAALRKGMRPILTALDFLHRRHLVQGGLKPSNIVLVNQRLKLASDTVRPSSESTASIAGSSVYDPPESRDGSFCAAGDIWSLGVFMVEALTRRRPSWSDRHFATAILPETLPPQFVQIVRQCLNRNPANRPTIAELEAQIRPGPQTTVAAVRYPVVFPPEPRPAPRSLAFEMPEPLPLAPAQQWPRRRSFVPAGTAILVAAIVAWAGLRLLGSQAYSRPTTLPAATATAMAQNPAAPMPAASKVSADSPDPGLAETHGVVAPPSVLHEEAPDVPIGALATVSGHIKFSVRVTVDPSGNVVRATLANHSPSRYFTRLAIETARKWKFVAADDQDSRQWMLRFEFTRDGAAAHASASTKR
jgi:TonB family protein